VCVFCFRAAAGYRAPSRQAVGPLALASEVLLDSTGEQSLVLCTAQPGTDTADKLELLRVLGREKFAELREVL
jgi:hypothetical protein